LTFVIKKFSLVISSQPRKRLAGTLEWSACLVKWGSKIKLAGSR